MHGKQPRYLPLGGGRLRLGVLLVGEAKKKNKNKLVVADEGGGVRDDEGR